MTDMVDIISMAGNFLVYLFVAVLVVFFLYALALIYHWYSYGVKKKTNSISTIVLLTGGILLLLIMATALFS